MTKKRSRRKQAKRKGPKGQPAADRPASTTASKVAERIAAAGPKYLEDNFVRIMQASTNLRQEPEFVDLYFEPRPTLDAVARYFPRFRSRLMRAARRGTEAVAPVYDDYRIAVMDDLDTPQFRRQLQRRLERCMGRLTRSGDVDNLEIILVLSMLLGDEGRQMARGRDALPLGVYGLATAIYEDSYDRAMREVPSARDIVGDELYDLWCAEHHDEDLEVIAAAVERISAFDELGRHIERNPRLALAWERQQQSLVEDLQLRMASLGFTFSPGLFTHDEAALAIDMMEQRHLSKPWSLSRYFALPAMISFTNCIRDTVDEIVTPERMAEMIEAFRSVGREALESDDDRLHALVPHVQAAIHYLQSEPTPSRNRIVGAVYLLSCVTVLGDLEDPDPRWQRFFKRLEKSRLLRNMDEIDDEEN